MKIPEIPGNYRPGDVVNGHILTERGHWVDVGNARAAGLGRRYLSTNVSTIRDPDKPSSELTGTERQAAERETASRPGYRAPSSAHPPPPAGARPSTRPPAPPPAAGTPARPQVAAPPPPGPRAYAAPSSSAGTGAVVAGGATQPPPPGGRRNPYAGPPGGATSQAAPQSSTSKFSCGGCLAAIVVIVVIIVVIVAAASAIVDTVRNDSQPFPVTVSEEAWEEPVVEVTAAPSFRLDDEELALVEIAEWDVWSSEFSSHYIVWIEAPGVDRPRVNVSFTIDATDDDGVTHTFKDYVVLRPDEASLAVGFFRERLDVPIVDMELTINSNFVSDHDLDYAAWVEDLSLDNETWHGLSVTIGAEGDEAPGSGRLTTFVRDDDGEIINLGVTYPTLPEPDEWSTIDVILWAPDPVSGDDDFEFVLAPN